MNYDVIDNETHIEIDKLGEEKSIRVSLGI